MIGLVSDTHGHEVFTRQAVTALAPFEPELVIHTGDIGSTRIIELFASRSTHYVFGNVDDLARRTYPAKRAMRFTGPTASAAAAR